MKILLFCVFFALFIPATVAKWMAHSHSIESDQYHIRMARGWIRFRVFVLLAQFIIFLFLVFGYW